MREWLIHLLLSLPTILIALSVHECAHAWAAYKLGDSTAKNFGRMTINPLKHLDPLGVLCMIVAGFGWARPVPVNSRNLRNPKRDMVLISLAGPASNIVLAFIGLLILRILQVLVLPALSAAAIGTFGVDAIAMLLQFLMLFCMLNAGLAIFNLLPIPPLDGSHLLALILPSRIYFKYVRYERYISFALVLLLVFNVLDIPLLFLRSYLLMGLEWIIDLIPFL
jgi:Zn-dependent protease